MTKVCSACKVEKPLTDFLTSYNNQRGKSYPVGKCKPCLREYKRRDLEKRAARNRERRASDPEYKRRAYSVSHKWRYGITLDEKDAMLAAQGGVCAICNTPDPGKREWCVDHDHACCPDPARSCGKCIRGIICARCNFALGQMDDDVSKLQAAIEYLNRTRVVS